MYVYKKSNFAYSGMAYWKAGMEQVSKTMCSMLIITLIVVKPVCFVYKVQVCMLCTCMDIMYVCTLPLENCATV